MMLYRDVVSRLVFRIERRESMRRADQPVAWRFFEAAFVPEFSTV